MGCGQTTDISPHLPGERKARRKEKPLKIRSPSKRSSRESLRAGVCTSPTPLAASAPTLPGPTPAPPWPHAPPLGIQSRGRKAREGKPIPTGNSALNIKKPVRPERVAATEEWQRSPAAGKAARCRSWWQGEAQRRGPPGSQWTGHGPRAVEGTVATYLWVWGDRGHVPRAVGGQRSRS